MLLLVLVLVLVMWIAKRALTLPRVEAASSSPWCLFALALLGQKTEGQKDEGQGRKSAIPSYSTVAPQLASYQPG